jgi:hypothetical protein
MERAFDYFFLGEFLIKKNLPLSIVERGPGGEVTTQTAAK